MEAKLAIKDLLIRLPERMKDSEFVRGYQQARSLYTLVPKEYLPQIDGVPADEIITCLAATFRDRFIGHKLVPVYQFYFSHSKCLRWLKGHLQDVPLQQANIMKENILETLLKVRRYPYNEEMLDFIAEELKVFDNTASEVSTIDINTNWTDYFKEERLERLGYKDIANLDEMQLRSDYINLVYIYNKLSIKYVASDDLYVKLVAQQQRTVHSELFQYQIVPDEIYYHKLLYEVPAVNLDAPDESTSLEQDIDIIDQEPKNSDYTLARKVLAIHFLFEHLNVKQVDATVKADFIQLLTGHGRKNIYDAVRNPLITKRGKYRIGDIKFVRSYFSRLGLTDIVEIIDRHLEMLRD